MTVQARSLVRISAPRQTGPTLLDRVRRSSLLMAILAPIAILIVWEGLTRMGLLDQRFFPAPSSIIVSLFALNRAAFSSTPPGRSVGC